MGSGLKAISCVLLLQSSNSWVLAAIVVGKKYFASPDQCECGFCIHPHSPSWPDSVRRLSGPCQLSVTQGRAGLRWREGGDRADTDRLSLPSS